ncbi:MAG: hypothetical protein KAT65_18015 [Methanophagales archaeon]|nr:hypothetical protein [Methanophagales archaeon]
MVVEKIHFGNFAAEKDILQKEHAVFVTTSQDKALQLPQHRIIFGRKGSGKTALAQEFSRTYKEKNDFLLSIDADAISFRSILDIYRQIEFLVGSRIELRRILANIWEYAIFTNCMNTIVNESAISTYSQNLSQFLTAQSLLNKKMPYLLVNALEGILQISKNLNTKTVTSRIEKIDEYLLDTKEFKDACEDLQKVLVSSKGLLVIIDKVDTYFDIERSIKPSKVETNGEFEQYALNSILGGLVQAVYNISVSPLGKKINFKVFLPYDKYHQLLHPFILLTKKISAF